MSCRPMIIVINGNLQEEKAVVDYLRSNYLPSRLMVLVYLMGPLHPQSKNFPVNFLRNLAIRNVETTHYIIMDMDMWPTRKDA